MGKKSKESPSETADTTLDNSVVESTKVSYEDRLKHVSRIAQPMAPKKLTKKLYKVIKKSSKQKHCLRSGLKEVQGRLRKGEEGLVVFAGDVTPIEVMCHLPAVCEGKGGVAYVYTPSRKDLGSAMGVKRGSLMVLIKKHEEYKELFEECWKEVQALPSPLQQE